MYERVGFDQELKKASVKWGIKAGNLTEDLLTDLLFFCSLLANVPSSLLSKHTSFFPIAHYFNQLAFQKMYEFALSKPI